MQRISIEYQRVWKNVIAGAAMLGMIAIPASLAQAKGRKINGPQSYIRILDAVPRSEKVDFYVNRVVQFNDEKYDDLSTYARVRSGWATVRIVDRDGGMILNGRHYLDPHSFYTVLLWGTTAAPHLAWADENSKLARPGYALFYAFALAPSAPPVDVVGVTKAGHSFTLFSGLRYRHSRWIETPIVGPMELQLRAGGALFDTLKGQKPLAGRNYSIFILGRPGANGEVFRLRVEPAAHQ